MQGIIQVLFIFVIMMAISSLLNIFLKTTKKVDWLMSLLISFILSIIFVVVLN